MDGEGTILKSGGEGAILSSRSIILGATANPEQPPSVATTYLLKQQRFNQTIPHHEVRQSGEDVFL
jgi:hypothetical protein